MTHFNYIISQFCGVKPRHKCVTLYIMSKRQIISCLSLISLNWAITIKLLKLIMSV